MDQSDEYIRKLRDHFEWDTFYHKLSEMATSSFLLNIYKPPSSYPSPSPSPSPASSSTSSSSSSVIVIKSNLEEPTPRFSKRKIGAASLTGLAVLARGASKAALGLGLGFDFDFRLTEPEQTVEEALGTVRGHARALLDVKPLLMESESWKEAQQQLRRSAAYLKQDIYTIIQSKPETVQPQLRKLYFNLFSSVSKLDYAARDKDAARVWECYNSITVALGDILSKLL